LFRAGIGAERVSVSTNGRLGERVIFLYKVGAFVKILPKTCCGC